MNGKKHDELSPVPQEFKDGGKGYKYGGRENWTVTGFPRERFTKNQLTEDFRNNFQTVLNTPGKTTIREDVYVGIGVQEQGDYVWYDIIFAHELIKGMALQQAGRTQKQDKAAGEVTLPAAFCLPKIQKSYKTFFILS